MKQKLLLLMLTVLAALSLVACGEIKWEKIEGDWKVSTVNGQSVAEFAAAGGVAEYQATMQVSIKNDDTAKLIDATGTKDLFTKRGKDGVELYVEKDLKTLAMSLIEKDGKLTANYKVGEVTLEYVFEKGTVDFDALKAEAEAAVVEEETEVEDETDVEETTDVDVEETTDDDVEVEDEYAGDEVGDEYEDPDAGQATFTAQDLADNIMGYSWVDDEGAEYFFDEDMTLYVYSPDGDEVEGEWNVGDNEDGSVEMLMSIGGSDATKTVVAFTEDSVSFDDGSTLTYVEEE